MNLPSASFVLWAGLHNAAGLAADLPSGKGRRSTSWIEAGDGAYDCAHAPHANPCESVYGTNILPLPPNCKQYMLCVHHQLAEMFSCSDGMAFDHRVKTCVSVELTDCPCIAPVSENAVAIQARAYDDIASTAESGNVEDGTGFRGHKTKTSKAGVATTSSKSGKQAKVGKGSDGSSKSAKSKTGKALFADTAAGLPTVEGPPPSPGKETLHETEESTPCAPLFDKSVDYEEGAIVSVTDLHNPGVYFEHTCKPRDPDTTCGHVFWDNGWILTGECRGEVATASPTDEPDEPEVVDEVASFAALVIPPSITDTTAKKTEIVAVADEPKESLSCMSAPANRDFESGIFPTSQWTTGGHGSWAIHEGDTYQGTYSIKSPDLSGASTFPAVSNATLTTCDDFVGGTVSLGLKASVLPPTDVFVIYVDGANGVQMMDVKEWREVTIDVPPGRHVIDFSYQYNMFNVQSLPPPHPGREGAVYIDDIVLTETPNHSNSFLAKHGAVNNAANPSERRRWPLLGLCGASLLLAYSMV